MKRLIEMGPVIVSLEGDDRIDFGYNPDNPEGEQVRLVTRGPEHLRTGRGSIVSLNISVSQLRMIAEQSAFLLRMIEAGRYPGDRPVEENPYQPTAAPPLTGKES